MLGGLLAPRGRNLMSFSFQFAFFVQPCGSIMARGMAGHVMTCNNIGEAMGMMLSGSSWARARQTVSSKPRFFGTPKDTFK